jgi:hypothetical protein
MQRILLIAAMLLPVASAVAVAPHVDIIADVNTAQFDISGVPHKTVSIRYNVTNGDVRAFALDINVDNGMNIGDANVRDFNTGESKGLTPHKGYGIFPGRFRDFVNPSNPDPCYALSTYNPTTPWAAPGAENTGLGWPKIVVELGTLYSGEPNKPTTSGTLFTFDINSEGNADCNMTVAVNALRGGIVGSDAAPITDTNLPIIEKKVTFSQGCTVPACVGGTVAACRAAILAAGFTAQPRDHGDWSGGPIGQVYYQNPAGGPPAVPCNTIIDFNDVNYPVKDSAPNSMYANWVLRGKPQCWAYPRQCHADVDGKKLGNFWVSANDNSIMKSGISKLESLLNGTTICADLDHKKLGNFWVSANDNSLMKSFISKLESLLPVCGNAGVADSNYHYYCLPLSTPATVCPQGMRCAPAGTCPNTP